MSDQHYLNQVGLNEFLGALQRLSVNKDNIRGEPLTIKYSNVTPYSTHHQYSTPTKYED